MKFRAILFDFDGTLANTMDDLFLAWKEVFRNYHNIKIKKQDYFPLEGAKLIEIADIISKKYNLINPNLEQIVEFKDRYYSENHAFSFYPGVVELIEYLEGKKLLAIVSASPREKLEKTVPSSFLNKFNVIISGEDTDKGKPSPEPYLAALKKLNLTPKQAVVVENSPLGIKSAKNAKLYCIAISTTLDKKYLKEADEIVSSHEELKRLLNF